MPESYVGDDDPDPLPDQFEGIIGSNFGGGNYVRAVVEIGRTPEQLIFDTLTDDRYRESLEQSMQRRALLSMDYPIEH